MSSHFHARPCAGYFHSGIRRKSNFPIKIKILPDPSSFSRTGSFCTSITTPLSHLCSLSSCDKGAARRQTHSIAISVQQYVIPTSRRITVHGLTSFFIYPIFLFARSVYPKNPGKSTRRLSTPGDSVCFPRGLSSFYPGVRSSFLL